ncbi:MAG: TolC family protein [Elusimicrobiales bacterium]|nr:TolC family protein [Elusimicrobiales bacterium]
MKENTRTHKGDEKKHKIIVIAGKMMADNGPDAVSMNMIAEKMNITKPVLYYYFKNKDELIKECFKEGIKPFEEPFNSAISQNLTMEEKIKKLLENQVMVLKKKPDYSKYFFKLISMPKDSLLAKLINEDSEIKKARLTKSFSNENLPQKHIQLLLKLLGMSILGLNMEAHKNGADNIDKNIPAYLAKIIANGIKSIKTLAIALLICLSAFPAMAETITLDQAINIALRDNISVKNAEATSQKYDEYVKENIGGVYPQISLSGTYTHYFRDYRSVSGDGVHKGGLDDNMLNASLGLNQVLWAGGKVGSAIKMAKIYSKAGKEELKIAQKETIRQVKQMYYAVLLSKKMVEIQRETLDLSKQYLKTIEAKYKQGLSSDLELLRQRVEVLNNEPALTKAENSYEEMLLSFKNLLGMEPDADIELEGGLRCGTTIYANISDLYKKALESRAEYKDLKYMSDLYKEMVVIERAGHYPYLSLFAKQDFMGNTNQAWPKGDENGWNTYGGISLSLPIYSGGSVNSRVEQAKKQSEIIDNNLRNLERGIRIGVKTAWLALNEAASRQESQKTAVEQARKALKATETRFKNGLAGLLDLNDMALAFNKTQTLYSQAAHDTCSAGAQLEWTLGE